LKIVLFPSAFWKEQREDKRKQEVVLGKDTEKTNKQASGGNGGRLVFIWGEFQILEVFGTTCRHETDVWNIP
jgi:hypothetical protein